jgi:hypothetical protein
MNIKTFIAAAVVALTAACAKEVPQAPVVAPTEAPATEAAPAVEAAPANEAAPAV